MKVITYSRISKQDDRAIVPGVKRQRDDCLAFAHENGHEVVGEISDNLSASRASVKRPGFEQLVAAIEAGDAEGVIVWRTDRLCRRPIDGERIIQALEAQHGELFVTQSPGSGIADSSGLLMLRIEMAIAANEATTISTRVKRAKKERAADGKPSGGPRPYGHSPNQSQIVEPEAIIIREVIERVLAGEGYNALARELNARGVTTSGGKQWDPSSLRRVTTRPGIAGCIRRGSDVMDSQGNVPKIITRADYDRFIGVLDGRNRSRARVTHDQRLLSSVLVCGRCGFHMYANNRRERGSYGYRCVKKPGRDSCGRCNIVGPDTDELITEMILTALDGPGLRKVIAKVARGGDEGKAIADRDNLEERRLALAEDYAAGLIARDAMLAGTEKVVDAVRKIDARLARHSGMAILSGVDDLRHEWEERGIGWRRDVVRAVIERIEVAPSANTTAPRVFSPKRLSVRWRG